MFKLNVKIRKLHADAVIPQYATDGAAGFDLVVVEDVIIAPGETVKVPLGLAFEIPPGYEMQIRPRSGVTSKTKMRVQIGTIDADYRGEVAVIVDNISIPVEDDENDEIIEIGDDANEDIYGVTYTIEKGDRIAQGVIQAVPRATFTEVDELTETERGDGGFGHTGVN